MTMEIRKKVALAYVRVSTEEQADGGSPDTQRAAIQAYADQNSYTIAKDDWFEDLGVSAKTAKRPDLQRMLETVERRKGEIDAVIIYNSTRISRDMLTFFCDIFARLRKNGVALKSATEYYGEPDDPTGDVAMILGVMVGEIDNKTKSKFTKDNMKSHLNESGWWMGGRTPLGFKIKRIPVEGKQRDGHQKSHAILIPDDTDDIASKITFLLNRFSEGDLKPSDLLEIAHKMNLKGYKGDILAQSTLDTILTNEIYAGWHKSKTMTDNKPVKMNFDGLISWEVFEKNQRILSNGADRSYNESDNSLYPLKKTACCAICGAAMSEDERRRCLEKGRKIFLRGSGPQNGSGDHNPRYSCSHKGHGSALASDIHQTFEDYLKQITPEEGTIKLFKEIVKRTALKNLGNLNKEIEEYEQERAELSKKRQKAITAFLDGDISKEEKEEYVVGLDTRRNKVEEKISKLKQAQLLKEADIEYVCNYMRNPAKLWRDGDLETKKAIQKMIFPHGIYFDLKNKKCGTSEISPLFSINIIKKAPNGANLSNMGYLVESKWNQIATEFFRVKHIISVSPLANYYYQ